MKGRARRLAPCAMVALWCGLAVGCRTALPPVPLPAGDTRPQALLAALAAEADGRHSLRSAVKLSLDGPAGSVRASQVLLVEQPSHLRVEVQGFLSQTIAVLVTDGEHFQLYRAGGQSVEDGRVYPGLLWQVAQVDLTPEEAVQVLLGAPRVPPGLVPTQALRLYDGGIRVALGDPLGPSQRVLEWDTDGRLRRLEMRTPGDSVLWQAEFSEWQRVDGEWFAHTVSLHFPVSKTEVELTFRDVELNPELPSDAFVLHAPRSAAALGGGGA
ncbi:MAG TPA: hypothetical protein VK714_02370 [Myxococcota bacterium]|nr:hypothetical protein [Myxococcota bacterium]